MDAESYKYLGFTLGGIAVALLIFICCMYERISLSIAVIKCSARFVF